MKPCSKNRKFIAWLAVGALEARQAQDLRAHLECCAGCRRYLEEISCVTERLAAAEVGPDLQASESFHRRVVGALRAETSESIRDTLAARLRGTLLAWRVAVPVIGAAAVVIALWMDWVWRPGLAPHPQPKVQIVRLPDATRDLPPTVANYQRVANRSLEELDELLTRQGNRNLSSARLYTASDLARANGSD